MNDNLYVQCSLRKGSFQQVAFIPAQFAVVGKVVTLTVLGRKDSNWDVIDVYDTIPKDFMADVHQEIKMHRRNTGDSMPKKKSK